MDKITIRQATEKDTSIILTLLYELGRPKPKKDLDVKSFEKLVQRYLVDLDKTILLAENKTVVGMVSIIFLPRLNQKFFEMYIPELIIIKPHQNQGIGKKLINECFEMAKEKKCHRIRLESENLRKESHLFYKNLGFDQSALSFSKELK